jgi:hypothetical protein
MQAAVGGNVRYPNLQSIADLFRSFINDTANNTTGAGTGTGNQAGLIMPNSNPDLLGFMDSAIQEIYSDLRNVGDPELILDNYILTGLPPVNSSLGVGSPNPATQVALAYQGFFDGVQWWPQWTLPIAASRILRVWERWTNTNDDFQVVRAAPFGLPGGFQGVRMALWEMREGMIWMPGCIQSVDLRLRGRIGYPTPLSPVNLNFATAYVPILDCRNAIVAKMKLLYCQRFAPEQYQMCIAEESRLMGKLKLEVVRQMQSQENQRAAFGDEAVADFAISWSSL